MQYREIAFAVLGELNKLYAVNICYKVLSIILRQGYGNMRSVLMYIVGIMNSYEYLTVHWGVGNQATRAC